MKQINLNPKINWQTVSIVFMILTIILSAGLVVSTNKLENYLELQNKVTTLINEKIEYIGQKEYSDRIANQLIEIETTKNKTIDSLHQANDSLLAIDKSAPIYFINKKNKINEKRITNDRGNVVDTFVNYVRTNENRYARYR